MLNKIIWIGTKESDILHTNHFFSNSITACGSGKNGNFSFSAAKSIRINYNINNSEYTEYLLEQMEKAVKEDSTVQFMYYNPYYAHSLKPSLVKHICCLNPQPVMDLLRSKCEMRTLASKYIPIVPFERILGADLHKALNCSKKGAEKEYIVQENISSGGEGTYIISNADTLQGISENTVYLLAPYYEKSIPLNINFIIFDDGILVFPPSVQIIQRINGKLLFMGTDYHLIRHNCHLKRDLILQNTLKLASALKAIGYRGIGGFDYIWAEEQLLFLECNPRFQASTYLLNLSLEKLGVPSVQELNFKAFRHENMPEFDSYIIDVPYSCVAHSYQLYLEKVFFRKEWYQHPDVSEILEDGIDSKMAFMENAYLYRIVFSKSITDITPEFELISYDNLLPTTKEWYQKIVSQDRLALKISLLNQGIFISQNVLDFIKCSGGIKDSVFDSIDLILEDGIMINCPYKINYADFSPFSLEQSGNHLELYYFHKCLGPVSLEPNDPDKEQLTKVNGVPYRRLSYLGGDRLRVHHTDICVFKRGNNYCQFCNLPMKGFEYTEEDLDEIIDFYLIKGGFRHILIGGGSEPISCESDTVLKLVKDIRAKTDMPIYLMCLPIRDRKKLEELCCAGVTEIGFNIEIWDDQAAKKLMPGKGSISREVYLDALKCAKEIWEKPYAVRSLLIIGLEASANTEKAVYSLCSEGIMPILSIFRPLPNSKMSDCLPPTNEFLYNLYGRLDKICREYDQHLGPDCINCQNNTLSLPW